MRFERGMDITAPPRAMARACELLEQIGAGKPPAAITDVYPAPYQPKTMRLERERIAGLLGHGRAGRRGRANPDVAGLRGAVRLRRGYGDTREPAAGT